VHSLLKPTPAGDWFSAAVVSDGSYGVPEGLVFSYPLRSRGGGEYEIVQGLELSDYARRKLQLSWEELLEEKAAVAGLIG